MLVGGVVLVEGGDEAQSRRGCQKGVFILLLACRDNFLRQSNDRQEKTGKRKVLLLFY